MNNITSPRILVTGFSGFVGKVVVEELCRQTMLGQLPELSIVVMIRASRGRSAKERFDRLQKAICFNNMQPGWQDLITLVEADMEKKDLGLGVVEMEDLTGGITHIIHCAASIDFDMPLKQAARLNVDTSLNILEFARQCTKLDRLIDVSTAYVHAATAQKIPEALAPLPPGWKAPDLLAAIYDGTVSEKELLRSSGHANTYTLTKCIAEHLLVLYRGNVPLHLARPSIINCALKYPFPGYTDSYGCLGGFGALLGSGFLHAAVGDSKTKLDVVPVDLVAQHLIDISGISSYNLHIPLDSGISIASSDDPKLGLKVPISHCVAGVDRSGSFGMLNEIGIRYFSTHREVKRAHWRYTGPENFVYKWHILTSQTIPSTLIRTFLTLTGQNKRLDLVRRLDKSVKKLNKVFPYFLLNTFDFDNQQAFPDDFDIEEYAWLTARSVHRHLIKRELWQEEARAQKV